MTPDRHRDTYDPGPDEHDTGQPSPSELAAEVETDKAYRRPVCEVTKPKCGAPAVDVEGRFCGWHGPQW